MAKNCTSVRCATSVRMGDVSLDSTELKQHPNAMPFTGTLLLVDEPSDQPPHGSEGHLIQVSKKVAQAKLSTLPGMAVNMSDDLEGHNPGHKVGVIQKAWLEGNKVKFAGVVWKKDFPEEARALKQNRNRLGASMELGDVYVQDKDDPVWQLEDFHFTGATILKKDHAAYENTEMAASKHFVNALAAAREATERCSTRRRYPRFERLEKAVEEAAKSSLRKCSRKER